MNKLLRNLTLFKQHILLLYCASFLLSVTAKVIVLSAIMLNVDMLNVIAPSQLLNLKFWQMKIIQQQNNIFSFPSFQSWYHENINKRSNQY